MTRRLPYLCLAYACVGLGAIGIVLPLLPTTPFLLVAAWAAPKGSARLDHWLHNHRHFGPILHAWQQHRAVPRRAKWLAGILMLISWVVLLLSDTHPLVPVMSGLLFLAVGIFLATRPDAAYRDE